MKGTLGKAYVIYDKESRDANEMDKGTAVLGVFLDRRSADDYNHHELAGNGLIYEWPGFIPDDDSGPSKRIFLTSWYCSGPWEMSTYESDDVVKHKELAKTALAKLSYEDKCALGLQFRSE